MDSKELRIGNYISLSFMKSKIAKVVGIDYHKVWYKIDNNINFTVCPYIEPIPLTEEWSLKFGFEKTNIKHTDNSISENVYKNYPLLVRDNKLYENKGKYITARFVPSKINEFNFLTHIDYVHTLQNLYFALTNTELIIK